jgi:hypothetical protein
MMAPSMPLMRSTPQTAATFRVADAADDVLRDLKLPGPPAGMERKVQAAACAAQSGGVGIELRGIAHALDIEECLDVRALVPACLEIYHPTNAIAGSENAVHHERADTRW